VYVKPTAPRSIGGVLDDGLRLWRISLPNTWQLALMAQLLVTIPLVLLRLQLKDLPAFPTPGSMSAASAANAQFMLALMKSPIFLSTYAVVVLATLGFYNAVVLRIAAVSTDSAISLGRSVASGFRLLPRVIWLFVILVLAAALIAVVLGVLAAVTGGVVGRAGSQTGSLAASVTVILLVLFFGFLLGRIVLATIALIVEDARAIESLKVSWVLTRGHWWRCAAILTVLIIIGVVLAIVITFVNGLIAVSLGPTSLVSITLTQILSILTNTVLWSLYPAVLLAIFDDLKLRKEGGDLASRVSALAPP
jgi:hypothetical protein